MGSNPNRKGGKEWNNFPDCDLAHQHILFSDNKTQDFQNISKKYKSYRNITMHNNNGKCENRSFGELSREK
jgi:hypothetical protein